MVERVGPRLRLSASQRRDLRDVAEGLTRGESERTCASLCRLGLLWGDWLTGYYLTDRGRAVYERLEATGWQEED